MACMSGVETGDITADHQWKGLHYTVTQIGDTILSVSILFLFLATSRGKYQVFVRMILMLVLPSPMLEMRYI